MTYPSDNYTYMILSTIDTTGTLPEYTMNGIYNLSNGNNIQYTSGRGWFHDGSYISQSFTENNIQAPSYRLVVMTIFGIVDNLTDIYTEITEHIHRVTGFSSFVLYSDLNPKLIMPASDFRFKTIDEISQMLKINLTEKDLYNLGVPPEVILNLGGYVDLRQLPVKDNSHPILYMVVDASSNNPPIYVTDFMLEKIVQ